MNVIAKFTVVSITDNGPHAAKQVKLNCTYDTTIPEDQRFLKATPWGENSRTGGSSTPLFRPSRQQAQSATGELSSAVRTRPNPGLTACPIPRPRSP
jgi:hypothetical protein